MNNDNMGLLLFLLVMASLLPAFAAVCLDLSLPLELWLQRWRLNQALRSLGAPWHELRASISCPSSFLAVARQLAVLLPAPAGELPASSALSPGNQAVIQ